MRHEIVTAALALGPIAKDGQPAVLAAIERAVARGTSLLQAMVDAGIDRNDTLAAAASVTGLPPAPRLLLNDPQPPAECDADAIRGAGGVPLGSVQGRLWIAFCEPDAARAAVFGDDVVVCLAHDGDLTLARDRFDALHPPSDDPATIAVSTIALPRAAPLGPRVAPPPKETVPPTTPGRRGPPVSPAPARSVAVPPPTRPHRTAAPAAPTPDWDDATAPVPAPQPSVSDEDLFDPPADDGGAIGAVGRSMDSASPSNTPDRTAESSAVPAPPASEARPEPARLRLQRIAQLERLKRFRFERVLGHGGMATVYLATDTVDGGRVAVKVLEPHLAEDDVAVGRFRRELRALRALHHPHILRVLDGDAEGGGAARVFWLATPYADGGTLAELLARTGPMPPALALPVVGALLEALAHAHKSGVLHRDLKPHNVLLGRDGAVVLSDFGIAKAVGDAPLTRVGARFGTLAYMAPEQARGEDVDGRADLYSVGVLLVELLTGKNPFARSSPAETAQAITTAEVTAPPDAPLVVRRLLAGLLARDRAQRIALAEDALDALRPALGRLPPVDAVVARALADPREATTALSALVLDDDDLPTARVPMPAAVRPAVAPVAPAPMSPGKDDDRAAPPEADPSAARTVGDLRVPVLPLSAGSVPAPPPAEHGAARAPQRRRLLLTVFVVAVVAAVAIALGLSRH